MLAGLSPVCREIARPADAQAYGHQFGIHVPRPIGAVRALWIVRIRSSSVPSALAVWQAEHREVSGCASFRITIALNSDKSEYLQ
jgi:hypothetical protein